jgi:hypothetical protein
MIIVKLIGGLGNQMFQYAAGKALASAHNTELLVDVSYLLKDPKGAYTKRELELNVFNIDLKIATEADIKLFNIDKSTKITRTLQRNLPFLYSNLYAAESGSNYQQAFISYPKNTYLEGFWQSEKYFKSISTILKAEFTLKASLSSENVKWMNEISNCESVSIHVRRGDYISNTGQQSHHICEKAYYENALGLILKKHKDVQVFLFSDDLDWCKKNLILNVPTFYVDSNQKQNFHVDLILMSHCKHNIIANSSYSWWAAWLNQNTEKVVIAPKKWFANAALNNKDLLPTEWITL